MRCVYDHLAVGHVSFIFALATTVLALVAVCTTQWFNFEEVQDTGAGTINIVRDVGTYGGLWRGCYYVQQTGLSVKVCDSIGSGNSKLNAVRALSILCIIFSFAVLFFSIAIALSKSVLKIPSFICSFLAMGSGISAVVVYAYYIDDINASDLGRNDILNWSYWLMVAAAACTGVPLLLNHINASKVLDIKRQDETDPEQGVQSAPTESSSQEAPKQGDVLD